MTTPYELLWEAEEERIARGIETHRKADVTVRIVDGAGRPMPGARVEIRQVSSPFLFGANAFMVGGYPSEELNRRYEDRFADLFNSATIPLYWKTLEPVPGAVRFEEGSETISRRPPPDRVLAFAEARGLSTVGHPLVWDFLKWSAPAWLPADPAEAAALWERRIAQIARRYGGRIPRWDVVNESLDSPERVPLGASVPMVENHSRQAFRWAEKHLPRSAHLMINETTGHWIHKRSRYVALLRDLLADYARVEGIGLQFHFFSDAENLRIFSGEIVRPGDLLGALDDYAQFNRPIHVSEITLTAPLGDPRGPEIQATLARNFYRLWFSHPAVSAITWWNVPDGGAAPGEDSVSSGLLDRTLEPKPAYRALHELIKTQWRTSLTATADGNGEVTFRGFHGGYAVSAAERSAEMQAAFDVPACPAVWRSVALAPTRKGAVA